MDLEAIWRRTGEMEDRLRRAAPNGLPYPRLLVARGLGSLTGANYAQPPPDAAHVRRVLEFLLERANACFDIPAQAEIVGLLDEVGSKT